MTVGTLWSLGIWGFSNEGIRNSERVVLGHHESLLFLKLYLFGVPSFSSFCMIREELLMGRECDVDQV